MRLSVLLENTALSEAYEAAHGLSIFAESAAGNFLFDTGPGPVFARNAESMQKDLSAADFAFISHGHQDHGGGLKRFLELNKEAPVYIREEAFEPHFSERGGKVRDISLDPLLKDNPRMHFTESCCRINEQIISFSEPEERTALPLSNEGLTVKKEGHYRPDAFRHEQSLLLEEDGRLILFVGCAHRGLINITEAARRLAGRAPDVVIGGFHLSSRSGRADRLETQDKIGAYLNEHNIIAYTGHCTGEKAFQRIKKISGERLQALSTGMCIRL